MEFIKEFKSTPWNVRFSRAEAMRKKYSTKVPVVIDRVNDKSPKAEQNRFLVPSDMVLAQFLTVIRKKMPALKPNESICLFLHEKTILPTASSRMADLYAAHHDKEDNFLYFTYAVENCFGAQ
jgi:hypothetical protein